MTVVFHNQGFSAMNKLFRSEESPNLARKLLLSQALHKPVPSSDLVCRGLPVLTLSLEQ